MKCRYAEHTSAKDTPPIPIATSYRRTITRRKLSYMHVINENSNGVASRTPYTHQITKKKSNHVSFHTREKD
jgi:hypothetical protein